MRKSVKSLSFFLRRSPQAPNTAAATYLAQVNQKNWLQICGADSVFDYLLAEQEVDRAMFDRQIDLIMKDFCPVAQKFLKHVAKVNGLWKMTLCWLEVGFGQRTQPRCHHWWRFMIWSWNLWHPLGEEYSREIARYQTERWVDFAANEGKDSGGYAADPYRVHPYVLMSWTGRMSDVYTPDPRNWTLWVNLSSQTTTKSYFNAHMSTYYVEAPSTFNELLLSDYLEHQFDDPRQKRFAWLTALTDTYFHNFITHLLEAAFQRKVYTLIEEGGTFGASKLNSIMKEVLTEFWGDAVEIDDDAALTWMRQSHYYMGLYSYTYSAGLVISTAGYLHLKNSENGS